MIEDWRALNRAMWDAATPGHLQSPLYDLAGFEAGALSLRAHEIEDLGEVRGRDLVHLQCHIGLDTLSWARLGARVTGLDFSTAAIAAAQALAARIGAEARFVAAEVYDAPAALGAQYDIVYTGVGALNWLPDMDLWARTIHALLRRGGQLYLYEFHPLEWVLGDDLTLLYDYFTPPEGYRAGPVTYAGQSAPDAAATLQWNHPLGEVVTALVKAGLMIETLRELDSEVLARWPDMVRGADGLYRLASPHPSLPLMYVLKASKP